MKRAVISKKGRNVQRKRDALVAAGVAPSQFGKRKATQPHRDRKHAVARGARKHKRPWA